jgi:hypothetical protein
VLQLVARVSKAVSNKDIFEGTNLNRYKARVPVFRIQNGQQYIYKLEIFRRDRLLWESDIGSDVMEFTLQNWARWERGKPDWFTTLVKASVPDEFIPGDHLAGLGGPKRMRRGSAAENLRESFRMIEVVGGGGSVEEVEEVTKVETIEGVEETDGDEDAEEEKEAVMMEEGAVDIMSDID